MEDKLLPCNLDAEQHLLQSCFVPGGIDKAARIVTPSDFYSTGVGLIFSRMLQFHQAGRGYNLIQIEATFEQHPDQDGIRRILDTMTPTTSETATYYAKIIWEFSIRRKSIKAFYQAYKDLFDVSAPVEEITERLRGQLNELENGGVHG